MLNLVPHSGKAFHCNHIIVEILVAQRYGGVLFHKLQGFLHEIGGVHFGQTTPVGAISATTLAEQHHVVGIVGA